MLLDRIKRKMKKIIMIKIIIVLIYFCFAGVQIAHADNFVEPVNTGSVMGTVSEIRYGPYYSGYKVWIRIPGSATGCNAPLDGGASEDPDFISLPLDRLGSDSKKVYLILFQSAKSTGQTVRVQYNRGDSGCEVLFVEVQ